MSYLRAKRQRRGGNILENATIKEPWGILIHFSQTGRIHEELCLFWLFRSVKLSFQTMENHPESYWLSGIFNFIVRGKYEVLLGSIIKKMSLLVFFLTNVDLPRFVCQFFIITLLTLVLYNVQCYFISPKR